MTSFNTFDAIARESDYNNLYEHPETHLDSLSAKQTARRLRRGRKSVASYRHNLLVAMRITNKLDKEMLQAEWENWLFGENERCEELIDLTTSGTDGIVSAENVSADAGNDLREWSVAYCKSCAAEKQRMMRAYEN